MSEEKTGVQAENQRSPRTQRIITGSILGSAALVLSSLLFIGSIAKKTVLTQDRHHDTEV